MAAETVPPLFEESIDTITKQSSRSFEECPDISISNDSTECSSNHSKSFDEDISISKAEPCHLIGPTAKKDELSTMLSQDESLDLPDNLKHSMVVDLPIGFYRLRRALLSSQSSFWTESVLKNTLSYTKITTTPWDRSDADIGQPDPPHHSHPAQFLGATRKTTYVMPASKLIPANMAFETATLAEYNDDFFSVQMSTSTPDVPFGKKFLARTQMVVVNLGKNACRMICSVETEFPDGPPFGVAGRIERGMRSGTLRMFDDISAHIRYCAVSDDGWC